MRALAFAALAACTYMPEPQGPRTVCNGTIVASSSVAVTSSQCEDIPADPCYDDDSEECVQEAERRREHNERVRERRIVGGFLTVAVIVGLLAYASTAH